MEGREDNDLQCCILSDVFKEILDRNTKKNIIQKNQDMSEQNRTEQLLFEKALDMHIVL